MSLEVLVVGAGPTGLTAAASLAQSGVKYRIIDKNSRRSDKSKALGVQAGTLEALRDIFGADLSSQMVAAGHPTTEADIHIDRHDPIRVDLSKIRGDFPYILVLEQSETERILEEKLEKFQGRVERNSELLSLKETTDGVSCSIRAYS